MSKNKPEINKPEGEMLTAARVGKAKKDFHILHGGMSISIKAGDEISEKKVPKIYWENLKTEGVL